jgi:tetraacyldisaccharide 4'-kinase
MDRSSLTAKALLGLPAASYYLVQKTWEKMFLWGLRSPERISVPVVSVGNLLLGGSGKTPFAIFLAAMLRDSGLKPAVVSRGYRGTNREPYLVVADGIEPEPLVGHRVAGDEPFLIAQRLCDVPVVIGPKRRVPAEAAARLFGIDVVILDDGFQHLPLARDLDIVLLNGREDCMFPLGRLREPVSALKRAHVLILMGDDAVVPRSGASWTRGTPVFRCRSVPVAVETGGTSLREQPPDVYAGVDVVLVSGIADPNRFRRTAERLAWNVQQHHCFPDHHLFTDAELEQVLARSAGAPVVVTEKDWVKLPLWFKNRDRAAVLRIGVEAANEQALRNHILERLGLVRS